MTAPHKPKAIGNHVTVAKVSFNLEEARLFFNPGHISKADQKRIEAASRIHMKNGAIICIPQLRDTAPDEVLSFLLAQKNAPPAARFNAKVYDFDPVEVTPLEEITVARAIHDLRHGAIPTEDALTMLLGFLPEVFQLYVEAP